MGTVDENKACMPTFVQSYSSDQFFDLVFGINSLDAKVLGNCEAACWVRQVSIVKSFTSSDQLYQLSAGIAAVDPKVFGNCEAACWVRQVRTAAALCMLFTAIAVDSSMRT
jgi:hypothetical protein